MRQQIEAVVRRKQRPKSNSTKEYSSSHFFEQCSQQGQFQTRYSEGMIEMSSRMEEQMIEFWEIFERFNVLLEPYILRENINEIINETTLLIHGNLLNEITTKYIEYYEQ